MSLARSAAGVVGVVYVLLGVIGFLPDPLVQASDAPSATGAVLGLVPINPLLNVVHLVLGGALLYASAATATAILVSRVIGAVLVALGLLGVVAASGYGFMPLGGGEIVLHIATAAMLVGSSLAGRATPPGS
jgi:hypothetical protein